MGVAHSNAPYLDAPEPSGIKKENVDEKTRAKMSLSGSAALDKPHESVCKNEETPSPEFHMAEKEHYRLPLHADSIKEHEKTAENFWTEKKKTLVRTSEEETLKS